MRRTQLCFDLCSATTLSRFQATVNMWQCHYLFMLAQVIDIASGAVLRTLPGDTESVTAIAVHPSGTQVVVASRSNVTKLWDIESGRCLRTWQVCH